MFHINVYVYSTYMQDSIFFIPKPEYCGLSCVFVFVAAGGAVPLLPNSPPLSGLGPSQWRGPAKLAQEAHLLPVHLDLRGQHAGQHLDQRLYRFAFFLIWVKSLWLFSHAWPTGGSSGGLASLQESGRIFPAPPQTCRTAALFFFLSGN